MSFFLGIDTSCYTTSCAVCDESGELVCDNRIILGVPEGKLGLRQSEMVFEHIKNLREIFPAGFSDIKAVAVSTRPRPAEGSYMPVFRVAESFGTAVSRACGARLFCLTHQHAHIGAALMGSGLEGELLALHVSGGTTELLHAHAANGIVGEIGLLGGTSDIAAGQFIDRIGVRLGQRFPAGAGLERLACGTPARIKHSVKGLEVSFSGAETMAERLLDGGAGAGEVAMGVQDCVARTLAGLIQNARAERELPVLLFGGVMQNAYIRETLGREKGVFFAEKRYSPDNSCGLAEQARLLYQQTET